MSFAAEIARDRGQPATVRIGTVTGVSPTVVSIQGAAFNDVGVACSYYPVVGDVVACLGQSAVSADGSSWLIVGCIQPGDTAPPGPALQASEITMTFASATQATQAVVFPRPFPSVPVVVPNISSGAGATSSFVARAINITATGFTMFVFVTDGIARAWTDVPVQYLAHVHTG